MEKVIPVTGAFFFVIWLPGIICLWRIRSLRGINIGSFMLEGLIYGCISMAVTFLVFTAFFRGTGEDILTGMVIIFTKGFIELMKDKSGLQTVVFLATLYITTFVVATLWRWRMGNKKREFSFIPESALDAQLLRIRDRRELARMMIETADGKKLEGICRIYTFTEPREVLLEIKEQDEEKCLWLKLDEGIAKIEIQTEPAGEDWILTRVIALLENLKAMLRKKKEDKT
ncbi:DUF6338 family protein [Moorella sp. Hama-1]|uniref:DUF6338 family protein n=1 Tax=Moorella sp. Hama-1 TaxID=2138101 RepID=UPI000D644C08|nr:DUF6338 family protein [Moorella sp. Hama-1]BCV20385.1 hypothetical protein hamaS1_04540 [Moorella sp. Hama-1]